MKQFEWIFLSLLIVCTACTKYGNYGDTDDTDWAKGGEAYYNKVIDLQTEAGEKYTTWSQTMDSLEAVKKLQQFFLADSSVTSATIGSQGIAVQYSNGMRGGVFLDPQDGSGEETLNLGSPSKTSASSLNMKSWVNNKTAIVLCPVYRSSWIPLIDEILDNYSMCLPKVGFTLNSVYKNQQAIVDRFTELSGYGIIDIDSHGYAWPENTRISEVYLQTGEVANLSTTLKYWKDVINGDLTVMLKSFTQLYFLSPKFITSHNDFSKDTVLFIGGFCYSMLGKWSELRKSFANGTYFGFDWSVVAVTQKDWVVSLISCLCDQSTRPPYTPEKWMEESMPPKEYYRKDDKKWVHILYEGDPKLMLWKDVCAVETTPITNITQITATGGGNVITDGGLIVTVRGVCWSTSTKPTLNDSFTIDNSGMGEFVSNLSELTPKTLYYVRAYATNHDGTFYGNQEQFTTTAGGGDGTFSYDGRTYKYKTIGTQTWMTENLAYLPSIDSSRIGSETAPLYYVYGYKGTDVNEAKATANYTTYGVLYNWPAAMNACPTGWHLPGDAEWTILFEFLEKNGYGYEGSGDDIAKSLAATSGWASVNLAGSIGNDQASNNSSGFAALPGGYRYNVGGGFTNGGVSGLGEYAYFWSATDNEWNANIANYLVLHYSSSQGMGRENYLKNYGRSVRCMKDNN